MKMVEPRMSSEKFILRSIFDVVKAEIYFRL